jgi:hypothetical protein
VLQGILECRRGSIEAVITKYDNIVGFEVHAVVVMKSTVFWVIMACSTLKVNQRFRGTYRLHLRVKE